MKRRNRLRRSADFQAVRLERSGAGDGLLRVQSRANHGGTARIGIAVTKRLGGAVVRNRIKRRLLALAAPHLGAASGLDLVLVPSREAVSASHDQLGRSLQRSLERVGAGR